MDIYENFIIGNFLFGLGVEMAFRHADRSMPATLVNLFQQTPLDKSYGDVIVKNPGIFRVLEFKREANTSEKEIAKLWMLKKGLRSRAFTRPEAEELRTISRKIHWYVEIPKRSLDIVRVVPYLDFCRKSAQINLGDFVRNIADEASSEPVTELEMEKYERYLQLLSRCRGSKSSGALLVLIVNRQVQYEPVRDIREVLLPREVILREQMAERQRFALEEEINMERAYERIIGEYRELSPRQELSIRQELSPRQGLSF